MTALPRPTFADTPEPVRAIMRGNKSSDTRPEVALRSALHALGYRFRKDFRIREGTRGIRADLVFTRLRVAVFVDGCFWHGCPEHGTWPRNNAGFWRDKIEGNVRRDRDTDARLEAEGWTVMRVWEHESPADAAARIAAVVLDAVGR